MRLRHIAFVFLLASLPGTNAWAGRVFGDIKLDGKPLPAGVPVMIGNPVAEGAKGKGSGRADSTATDKFGAYKLMVKDEGKCTLTILFEKQPLTIDVFSYKEATRYDLIVEKKDGKTSLRRK